MVGSAVVGWLAVLAGAPAEAGRRGGADPQRTEALAQIRDGSLAVGDPAPDAPVVTIDGEARTLRSALRGRPLVVVFGSFT